MAITTFNEELAVMALGISFLGMVPVNVGTIDQSDQQQFLYGFPTGLYAGDLVGSNDTILESRCNVERCGASRCGWYLPNVVITIAGVDRTTKVENTETLTITQNRAIDTPNTASFVLKPSAGFVPAVNSQIVISLGSASNRIFGGQVLSASHTYQADAPALEGLITVNCIDWTRLFDRFLVCQEWHNVSATVIARDIIAAWTVGFTSDNVAPNLPVIEAFICEGKEFPSGALRRLSALVGGTASIDANRDVHFTGRQVILQTQFPTLLDILGPGQLATDLGAVAAPDLTQSGESISRQSTPPRMLTTGLHTLQQAVYSPDGSQQRTRTRCEGPVTTLILPTPAGATSFPIANSAIFPITGGTARIGAQRLTYTSRDIVGTNDGGFNSPGGSLTVAALAGDQRLHISNPNCIVNPDHTALSFGAAWFIVGDQCISGTSIDFLNSTIEGIPATGFGSIIHDIAIGEFYNVLPSLFGVPATGPGSLGYPYPADAQVFATIQVDDGAAQVVLGGQEGTDGVREFLIEDSSLSLVALGDLAQADQAVFHYPVITSDWTTTDMNAYAGSVQPVSMGTTDIVFGYVLITTVDFSFLPTRPVRPPIRRCHGESTPLAELLNVVVTTKG